MEPAPGDPVRRAVAGGWGALARSASRMRHDLPLGLLDLAVTVAAYSLLLAVRFDGRIPDSYAASLGPYLSVAAPTHLCANWMWGLYGQMWRHASVQEARRVALAGLSSLAVLLVVFLPARVVPLSVIVLGAASTTMLTGAVRFQSRLFAIRRRSDVHASRRIVVIGAGETGAGLLRDMLRAPDLGLRPVALLDDDPRKQQRAVHGVRVEGVIADLPATVRAHRAQEALLAIPSADGALVRTAVRIADEAGVPLRVVPSVGELVNGRVSVRDVRDLRIDDLLGRSQVKTDLDAVRGILTGRRVLITGAGGSIGAEIARQVAACQPAELVLLEHDETHLYEAAGSIPGDRVEVLADIRDARVVDDVFARHRPEVVFHAAAHKHVPMLETHPCEAIRTNVAGTANVVDAAVRHSVDRFVLISTDKAVRPSSVMGASKRIAEQIVLSRAGSRRYCAVRFGNVLASRGSVVPRFMQQIQAGGPVTVTDPRMTRYFMTILEAVQLVLQAAALSSGGEVFMLDMGEPVRIIDLAERMIRLSGRRVGADVAIRITGRRPGEKLCEELHVPDEESPEPTVHPSIVVIRPAPPDRGRVDDLIQQLVDAAERRDEVGARLLFEVATRGTPISVGERDAGPRPLSPRGQTLLSRPHEEGAAWPASIT